jgi:hypothetical protein
MHPHAATYPAASNLTSLSRWAPILPHVPRPRTLPPYRGGLRRCHMSLSSGPHLPNEVGFGAAMCLMAPGSAFLRGELRCCHMSHGPQRAVDYKNKKDCCTRHAARLACFQGTLTRYRGACKTCGPTASS